MSRRLISLCTCLAAVLTCAVAHAGYTQYFTWKIDPSGPRLNQCIEEMSLLIHIRRQDLQIIPPDPKNLGADAISFNGIGNQAGEAFVFPGNTISHNLLYDGNVPANLVGYNTCKTDMKLYDEVVTACLLVARDHFTDKELVINSDGIWDDWGAGRKLYEDILGRSARSPLPPTPVAIAPPAGPQLIKGLLIGVCGIVILVVVKRVLRGRQGA